MKKYFLFVLVSTFAMSASVFAKPYQSDSQSDSSIKAELNKIANVLNGGKLVCTNTETQKVVLAVQGKQGSVIVKATYGDAGEAVDNSDTQVLQAQAGDVISLLVTGPDADEGGAMIVIQGGLSETWNHANGKIISRDASATALIYVDGVGETVKTEVLTCKLEE